MVCSMEKKRSVMILTNAIKDGKAWQVQGTRPCTLECTPPDESYFACETGNLLYKELNINIDSRNSKLLPVQLLHSFTVRRTG